MTALSRSFRSRSWVFTPWVPAPGRPGDGGEPDTEDDALAGRDSDRSRDVPESDCDCDAASCDSSEPELFVIVRDADAELVSASVASFTTTCASLYPSRSAVSDTSDTASASSRLPLSHRSMATSRSTVAARSRTETRCGRDANCFSPGAAAAAFAAIRASASAAAASFSDGDCEGGCDGRDPPLIRIDVPDLALETLEDGPELPLAPPACAGWCPASPPKASGGEYLVIRLLIPIPSGLGGNDPDGETPD